MASDKVSIIIVTFNASKTLSHAILSVNNQQYCNTELIIIDGASTDGTVDIIRGYNESVSFWKSETDAGIYDAMNKGIAHATGKWILFLGADDKLCEGVLNDIFSGNNYHSTDLIYGKVIFSKSRKVFGGESNYKKLITGNIPHQAIFYSKALLHNFRGYNLRYKILADYDLNLKIFEQDKVQKQFINKEIAVFCSTGVSNRTIDYLFFSDKLSYFISTNRLSKKDKRLAKYYFFIGVTMILGKRYGKGFENLMHPLIYGGRRIYFLLLFGHFILTMIGAGKKYKYV